MMLRGRVIGGSLSRVWLQGRQAVLLHVTEQGKTSWLLYGSARTYKNDLLVFVFYSILDIDTLQHLYTRIHLKFHFLPSYTSKQIVSSLCLPDQTNVIISPRVQAPSTLQEMPPPRPSPLPVATLSTIEKSPRATKWTSVTTRPIQDPSSQQRSTPNKRAQRRNAWQRRRS